jgi:hypothetical protein
MQLGIGFSFIIMVHMTFDEFSPLLDAFFAQKVRISFFSFQADRPRVAIG